MNIPYYKVPRHLFQDIVSYLRKGNWDDVNPMMSSIQTEVEGPFNNDVPSTQPSIPAGRVPEKTAGRVPEKTE